jgi:hypothetical protein
MSLTFVYGADLSCAPTRFYQSGMAWSLPRAASPQAVPRPKGKTSHCECAVVKLRHLKPL